MNEILCYGALCADHRIWLPRYPQPGEGVRIAREELTPGGNAFIEARSLAAWGNHVTLMGDHLGMDEGGMLLWSAIAATAIDASHIVRDPTATTPICRILLTPDGQRTILSLRDDQPPAALPDPALVARCRLVSVTRYGPHTARVAQMAYAAGRQLVVGDATRPHDPWAAYANVIVTSADLLRAHTPDQTIGAQMAALHNVRGAAVVVTDGPHPLRVVWQEDGTSYSASVTPPSLRPAHTIGAGDVVRAAVAHGLLAGWLWPQILSFACAEATTYLTREA